MKFSAAKENDLPLVWQALKNIATFPSFEALKAFQASNAASIQVSAGTLSCVGIVGSWRSHLDLGCIKVLVAPDACKKDLLEHLISVLRDQGFEVILSPPLRLVELSDFYEVGFRHHERIIILKKTNFSGTISSSTAIEICEFKPTFLPQLVKVEQESFSHFWRWGEEELVTAIKAGSCFVAFFKGTIIGYNVSTVKEKNGVITRLALLPEFQGRGFGAQLLSYSLSRFQRLKVRSILVTTQATNRAAQQLYAKFGFACLNEDRYILRLEL